MDQAPSGSRLSSSTSASAQAGSAERIGPETQPLGSGVPSDRVPEGGPAPAPRSTPAAPTSDSWLRKHFAFGLILLVGLYLITINVSVPWQSVHEDDGNLFTSAAISHIRYGLGTTKGQDYPDTVTNGTFGPPGVTTQDAYFLYYLQGPIKPAVYGHHPPLLGLTIAGSLLVFGYSFWAVRLVPIIFSILGLILLYSLVGSIFDLTIARCAAALCATFPMFAYFGRNVAHEAPTLCCALALLIGYLRWRETGGVRWVALMVTATAIGSYYDWPLLYFALIVFLVDWAVRRRPSGRLLLATVVPATIMFILVVAQIDWALGGNLATLRDIFLFRVAGNGVGQTTTAIAWLNTVAGFNAEGFGAWSQLAMPLAVLFVAGRASAEGWSSRVILLVICGLWGVSHILIFRDGALYHAYWQFYLLPFYAVALAWGAVALVRRSVGKPVLRAAVLVIFLFTVLCLNLPTIYSLYSAGTHHVIPLLNVW